MWQKATGWVEQPPHCRVLAILRSRGHGSQTADPALGSRTNGLAQILKPTETLNIDMGHYSTRVVIVGICGAQGAQWK